VTDLARLPVVAMSDQARWFDALLPGHVLAMEADSDRQCITVDEQKGDAGHVSLRVQSARWPLGKRVNRDGS